MIDAYREENGVVQDMFVDTCHELNTLRHTC